MGSKKKATHLKSPSRLACQDIDMSIQAWRKLGRGAEEKSTWEEVGIEVGEVTYHSLQPWPGNSEVEVFPHTCRLVPNGLEMRIRTMSSGEGSNLHFKAILNQVPFQAYHRRY